MRWWAVGVIAGVTFVACTAFEAGNEGASSPIDGGPDRAASVTNDASAESGGASGCPADAFCEDFESGDLRRWDNTFTGTTKEAVDVAVEERDGGTGSHALHASTAGAFGDASSVRVDAFAQKSLPVVPGGTLATRAWVRFRTLVTPPVYPFVMTARHDGDPSTQYFLDGPVLSDAMHWGFLSDHTGRDYEGASASDAAKPTEWTCLELDVRLAPDDANGRVRLFVNDRLMVEKARSTVDAATVGAISTYELWAGISRPGQTVAGDLLLDDIVFEHFTDDPSGQAPRIGCGP
jgi:hypothetical protein